MKETLKLLCSIINSENYLNLIITFLKEFLTEEISYIFNYVEVLHSFLNSI